MKWGTKYGPEYVNRLYAMVRRHLRGDFRFVCLTDRSDGMRSEVQCLPIPDLALPDRHPRTRLEEAHHLRGRPARSEGHRAVPRPRRRHRRRHHALLRAAGRLPHHPRLEAARGASPATRRSTASSSARTPTCSSASAPTTTTVRARFRNEQAYLSDVMHRQGKLAYWPTAWCAQLQVPLRAALAARTYWRAPSIPAGRAHPDLPRRDQPARRAGGRAHGNWRRMRPAPWIAEHWRE